MGKAISTNKTKELNEDENLQQKTVQEEIDLLNTRALEVIKEKKNEIKTFMVERSKIMKVSNPNDQTGTCEDKPLIYKISPNKNKYNLEIEIFNFPAILRKENGIFNIFNKLLIIFKYFSNKMKNKSKDEYERNFSIFFNSILDCDVKVFNELIEINIQKNGLYSLKQGLEKIIRYFGIKNVERYFNIYCSFGAGAAATLVGCIPALTISVIFSAPVIGIGVGVAIGLISYLIFKKFKEDKLFEINKANLEYFFDKIICLKKSDFMNCNIFVIAREKNNQNQINISLFPHIIDGLDPLDFPKIGANDIGDSNSKYYENLIGGIENYIKIYDDKFLGEKLGNDMANNIINDIQNLICVNECELIDEIRKKYEDCENQKINNNLAQSNNYEYSNNNNYNNYNQYNYNNNEIMDYTESTAIQNEYADFCYN